MAGEHGERVPRSKLLGVVDKNSRERIKVRVYPNPSKHKKGVEVRAAEYEGLRTLPGPTEPFEGAEDR